MSVPAVSLRALTKRYGRRGTLAVCDLTLDVLPGEVFGFLGLNGAGKSTTIRILLDLLRPTSGSAFVFGMNCQSEGPAVRASIGYLPGEIAFYGDMTGRAILQLLDHLSPGRCDPAWLGQLLERFELSGRDLDRRIRDYSTGMKRKLGLVQAFMPDPPLLILDEPTEGLDPLMQGAFHELLGEARRGGRTVFMSSHVLSEVERSCDRIGILSRGELGLVAPVDEVLRLAPRRVHVSFGREVGPPDALDLPSTFTVLAATGRRWSLEARGELGPLVARLSGLPVSDLDIEEATLDDVVMAYYRGSKP